MTKDETIAHLEMALERRSEEHLKHLEEKMNLKDLIRRLKNDRRERIATAAMQGLLSGREYEGTIEWAIYAKNAVSHADALIAALDAKEAK